MRIPYCESRLCRMDDCSSKPRAPVPRWERIQRRRRSLSLAVWTIVGLLGSPVQADDVRPFPRQRLPSDTVLEWPFDSGDDGWTAVHDSTAAMKNGVWAVTSTGGDPYVHGPLLSQTVEGPVVVRLRARCRSGGSAQFFWTTRQAPRWSEAQSARFPLIHDGAWRQYEATLSFTGDLRQLRLDPGAAPGEMEIDWIRIEPLRLHPLEIEKVVSTDSAIRLSVRNYGATARPVEVAGQSFELAPASFQELVLDASGDTPFQSIRLELRSPGLPSLSAPVFVVRPSAVADWIVRKSGDLTLEAARDGAGARLLWRGQPVAVVAPLVQCDGKTQKMTLAEQRDSIRFLKGETTVAMRLDRGELTVSIDSPEECEGPVVRVFGQLEQGLFAGQEYLGKNESSSSKLDIETEDHLRFAPDPIQVTMPLMACRGPLATVAMTWRDMSLQPVFAAPNFLDGPPGHRMALRGKRIEAAIRVADGPFEDAILWAVQKQGLPPLPKAPRTPDAQRQLCLQALQGPLKNENGWGHCAEPKWVRRPFADFGSTIFRLTGRVPDLPQLVPGGAHIPNNAIYFLTGRADQWRRMARARVDAVLRSQQPDGSFHYQGKYLRGHFEETASGYCALRAANLLDYAWRTGDQQAREAGIHTLEYMTRFRTPRGAQTWELSLHTPDILAAAHLVRAYVLGYQLTERREYLQQARKWALSGVPFVYLWGDRPVMAYATVPVYGATNWRAPNWIGLPVQWCGIVYAYAIARLAPYDDSLDWRRLARGILIAGEQMQYPDGDLAGCLPDSFRLESQQRAGPSINPCAVVSLRMAMDGKLDSLAVAQHGGHRVIAPFEIEFADGAVRANGKKSGTYQMLIDGHRIVDVPPAPRGPIALK